MHTKSFRDSAVISCLAFVPLLIYWILKEYIEPRHFWAFYDHIESLYYYTAIEIWEGITPHNIDNPGTPVQLIGSLLVAAVGVLPKDYELFLTIAHITIFLLSFFASMVMVKFCLGGVNTLLSVTVIWMYFLFSVSLLYFHVWSPEAFFFIFGALTLASLFNLLEDPSRITTTKTLIFGASVGVLIATKLIFLAWLPGLCLLLFFVKFSEGLVSSIKSSLLGLAGVSAGFFVITFPIREGYPYMFGWLLQNATRSGDYGRGEASLPSFSAAFANWQGFALSSKLWIGLVVLLLLATLISRKLKLEANNIETQRFRLALIFVIPSLIFSLLFIVRAYNQRYLLPMGLCGVIVLVLFLRQVKFKSWLYEAGFVTFIGLLLVKGMANDFKTHRSKLNQQIILKSEIDQRLSRLAGESEIEDPIIIYGWRAPSPVFALRQHARFESHQRRVDKLYPRAGHFTPWPVGSPTFRLPEGLNKWDFAVIRKEYVEGLEIGGFEAVESLNQYMIIKPMRESK